jgi:hypothetical protein
MESTVHKLTRNQTWTSHETVQKGKNMEDLKTPAHKLATFTSQYVELRAANKHDEAKAMLMELPKGEFEILYLNALTLALEPLTKRSNTTNYLVKKLLRFYVLHEPLKEEKAEMIDWLIYDLALSYSDSLKDPTIPVPEFAQELLNSDDPELQAMGKEIAGEAKC